MSDITVARRYAQALYAEAESRQIVEEIDADVEMIRTSMADSGELVRLFESPVISREKKEKIIAELFEGRVQPLTSRFLQLLIEKEREEVFPAIVRAYGALRDEQLGIVEARARVAHALDPVEEQKLVEALERMTDRRVRLAVHTDPAILGGVIIRVGDTVYDGSVRHQLESLREQLEHGVTVNGG